MMNVFVKPNEQNRACSRYAMARKGRMKSNVRNIWSFAALLLGFVALLSAMVGCNASDDATLSTTSASGRERLEVRFRVLMHENGKKTINKDDKDKEDYVESLLLVDSGKVADKVFKEKANSFNGSNEYGVANWQSAKGAVNQVPRNWMFVANLRDGDVNTVKNATSLKGVELQTIYYLRRYMTLTDLHPLVMVDTVRSAIFDAPNADGVRLFKRTKAREAVKEDVTLKRIFSRFSYQTYPLPSGYVIKKVTVERIPNKFVLEGDLTSFGTLDGLVLWDNDLPGDQPFAKWQRSRWASEFDPHPDMYLSGHFYLPPCKVNNSTDFFGTKQRGGMPVMRFVFTDNQRRTFVRLYRLGNSGDTRRGDIEANKHYDVRINLLGPYQERADTDTDLTSFDEGTSAKAAFVN